MSAPLVPSPLDYVGRRRFAFYPPIRNATPNEWVLGSGSRSEVQVVNAELEYELWVPRQYVGAVSEGDGQLLIVGLTKELDLHEGSIQPLVKRVIEMPHSTAETDKEAFRRKKSAPVRPAEPAPVIGIRLEQNEPSRMSKAIVALCIALVLIALLAAVITASARL